MSKMDLMQITGANNLSAINQNFEKLEKFANEGALWRDNPDNEPNQMVNTLDMNGNRIYNLPKPIYPHEPVRYQDLGDVTALTEEARQYAEAAGSAANSAAQDASIASLSSQQAQISEVNALTSAQSASDDADRAEDAAAQAVNRVPWTGPTGVAILPSGDDTEIPNPLPTEGLLVRFSEEHGYPVWYDHDKGEWTVFSSSIGVMFEELAWNGPLEHIPIGFVPANGQKWYADTYPEAAAALENGVQFIVSESDWQNGLPGNPDAYKGNWSSGGTDAGGRWYRMPKFNRDGAYLAPFLRGSEIGVDAGMLVGDAGRNLTGMVGNYLLGGGSGAFGSSGSVGLRDYGNTVSGPPCYTSTTLDASRQWPIAEEFRPRYHGVIKCMRMFGTVSNPGSVDAAQLATDLSIANAKIQELEDSLGFAIIYPNGGTAASPATITQNSRYVNTNPFPGFHCICEAQILINGKWAATGWFTDNASGTRAIGTSAHTFDGNIVTQTGVTAVLTVGNHSGSPALAGGAVTSGPCRVLVWKINGAVA